MKKAKFAILLALTGLTTSLIAEELPVVTRDENGQEVVAYVPREKYTQNIANQISQVQDEAVPVMNNMKQGRQWRVRTASLGIGIDIQLGLPYLITLGITPRINAVLSNAKNPALP